MEFSNSGSMIILMDQSGSMLSKYEGNDSKTVLHHKAVNRVIETIIEKTSGYNHEVHELTSSYLRSLEENPLRIEKIKKKQPDNAGGLIEVETKKMSIYNSPQDLSSNG